MSKLRKTIEAISTPKTASDLWDDLYKSRTSNAILSFRDGTVYQLRLVGPFVSGSRIFLPPNLALGSFMSSKELTGILKRDTKICAEVVKRVLNKTPDNVRKKLHIESLADINIQHPSGKVIAEIVRLISALYEKKRWQPIVFSNAIVLNSNTDFQPPNPAILCLSKVLCYQILEDLVSKSSSKEEASNKKLSGLHAHDITISRQGVGISAKYTAKISDKECDLPSPWVSYLLKEGLWDIRKIAKSANKRVIGERFSGFLYRLSNNYKMSKELMAEVFEQAQKVDDIEYVDEVDDNINELPPDAFENYANENTIGSLEL